MSVVTRFAPSPTGFLHIGSLRTAIFSWLYAKHNQGIFLLRIEDTDRERSTVTATDAIIKGMQWMNLYHDGTIHTQSEFAAHHASMAQSLLMKDKAYKCYCTQEELEEMRAKAFAEKRTPKYDGRCRTRGNENLPFVVRFKAPQEGSITIDDGVQGKVTVQNDQLDDMVLLRSDHTPTYLLSVVVDDHDMGITHVIRGDDHLTNTFRQIQLYKAFEWEIPHFSHIPLIHGPDGAKLSKRHGALGVEAYKEMGILPEALFNYLLRLGWAKGDNEIISRQQAIEWFDLKGVGRSPSRFDMAKLTHLNGVYIRQADNQRLVYDLIDIFRTRDILITHAQSQILLHGMEGLKQRAKTLVELADHSMFYFAQMPIVKDKSLFAEGDIKVLQDYNNSVEKINDWTEKSLEDHARRFAEKHDLKLGKLAHPIRIALTGSTISPSVFDIMAVLGKEEILKRLQGAV